MSYNGIGLPTPRGTATNGYVQRNLSNVYKDKRGESEGKQYLKRQKVAQRHNEEKKRQRIQEFEDPKLEEHERKRKIEVEVMSYRDKLEDELDSDEDGGGEDEDERMKIIEKKVTSFRKKLLGKIKKREDNEREKQRIMKEQDKVTSYDQKLDPFISRNAMN